MNTKTGSVDNYDEWWYEIDNDGFGKPIWCNAVDRCEVVEVVKDKVGGYWTEVN